MSDDKTSDRPLVGELVTPVNKPRAYNLTTVSHLIEAFHNDYNVSQACRYAGISRESYYNWLERYPDFAETMEDAQEKLNLRAGEIVRHALVKGDEGMAKWYKDRRDPRYKPKAEVDVNHGLQETRDKLKDFFDDEHHSDDTGEQPATADAASEGAEVAPDLPPVS